MTNELNSLNNSNLQLPVAVLKTKFVQFEKGSSFLQLMFGTGNAKYMELTVVNKDKISTIVRSPDDVIEPSSDIIIRFVRSIFTNTGKYN